MNGKLIALTLTAFVLLVAVSGCTTAPAGSTDTGSVDQQVTPQEENEVINSIDSELLNEDDAVEIGEMI